MPASSSDARVGTLWDARYRIVERIGAGRSGVVYRAEGDDGPVALEVFDRTVVTDLCFDLYRRDRAAARWLSHPGVLAVHACGRDTTGQIYRVMELCDGGSLDTALRSGPLPLEDAGRMLGAAAQVLDTAHHQGVAHGCLRPASLLLASGAVKVADFFDDRLGCEPSAYRSPEQREGGAADRSSDVYSLGALAYQALTGAHPLARPAAVPPPPRWLRPDLPESASRLLLRAMAADPGSRVSTAGAFATELVAALRTTGRSASQLAPPAAVAPAADAPRVPPVAAPERASDEPTRAAVVPVPIGRDAELQRLMQGLADALAGRGRLVTVAGEPGLGKTTLVTAFLDHVRVAHPRVLAALGRCSEHFGSAEAYLPLLEAVAMLAAGPGRVRVDAALRSHAPTWFMHVGPRGSAPQAAEPDASPAQDRMPRELTGALLALAAEHPLVLVLEDLHWADTATVDFIAHAAPRLAAARILVVGTYRPEDVAASDHPLRRVLRGLARSPVWGEVVPTPFSEVEVEAQLSRELGVAAPPELVRFVFGRTEGNPLFVTNVLNHLLQTGALQRGPTGVVLTQSLAALQSSVPDGVRGVIAEKIDRLDGPERRLLQAASVQGDDFEAAVAAALLAEDESACEERLDRLQRVHGLLQRVGEVEYPGGTMSSRYRFTHSLYQNVLYASIAARRLAEWHAQAGATLARLHAGHLEPLLVLLAIHFEKGRDPAQAIHYGILAAELLAQRSPREALPLLQNALTLSTRLPEGARAATRTRLLTRLGRHHAEIAEIVGEPALYERAEEAVEEALQLDPASSEARTILGLVHLERGHNWRAFLSFVSVLEAAPDHAPALDGLSYLFKNTALWDESLAMAARAAALDPRYAHSIRRLSCLLYQDRLQDARAEAAALVERRPRLAHYNYWAGITEYYAGDIARAREWIERGYALDPEDRIAQGVLAFVLAASGEAGRARELLRSAEQGAAADGTFTYWIAKIHAALGDKAAAVEWLARAEGLGYWNAPWIACDRAMQPLRGFAPFEQRLASIAATQADFVRMVRAHGLP